MNKEQSHTKDYLYLNRLLRKETIPPKQARLGYVMAETQDNQPASLSKDTLLLQQGVIENIAIPNPFPPYVYGYPGPQYCKNILDTLGVHNNQITFITPDTPLKQMNTQTELIMVADYLNNIGYKENIVIIAPWFHILRSYITALSEFQNVGADINIFISSVAMLDPYETVLHSQGVQKGTRRSIFREEVDKCRSYPNLISIDKAIEIHYKHKE